MDLQQVTGGILGLAVGDALGVPVEFYSRFTLKDKPVVDMRAYGAHHQPQGTWSDDSSLAFCLAEKSATVVPFDSTSAMISFLLDESLSISISGMPFSSNQSAAIPFLIGR